MSNQDPLKQMAADREWDADLNRCWSVVEGYAAFGMECPGCGGFTEVALGNTIPAHCSGCELNWRVEAPRLSIKRR